MNEDLIKKYSLLFIAIILALTGLSVSGLLQSTERVGSSGIIVRPPPIIVPPTSGGSTTIPVPPPEPVIEIDLFEDRDCMVPLSQVVWGEIEAGGRNYVSIYVKNKGDVGVYLSLLAENWGPDTLVEYSNLDWDYDANELEPGDILELVLELKISADCPELPSFNFDIVIVGT